MAQAKRSTVRPARATKAVTRAQAAAANRSEQVDLGRLGAPGAAVLHAAVVRQPRASGTYRWTPRPGSRNGETLRVDVDGDWPQMTVSGNIRQSVANQLDWIARVQRQADGSYAGAIWFKRGAAALLAHTRVTVAITLDANGGGRSARVTFEGRGAPLTREYQYRSPRFRRVNFEFDVVEGHQAALSMRTCDHPVRPPQLACETLTLREIYERAGFDVTVTRAGQPVPLAGAGRDALWTAQEMHDAMQSYWSHYADQPQWALWTFFTSRFKPDEPGSQPEQYGGIMFDDIGPRHRQGTAIFLDSFISHPEPGEPAPEAWVRRMRFWCAAHEMGHAFNLAHSWDKAPSTSSWIDLPDEREARSFMNYPYEVRGGETAFFEDFEYRFSDSELLFLRHAPEGYVQPGNADWFDNHAARRELEDAAAERRGALVLELRVNREQPEYEFMEPVTLELKLKNTGRDPVLIDANALATDHGATVLLKRDRTPARQWLPYAQLCRAPQRRALAAGESIYQPLYISSGRNGWDIAEPGWYTVQVILEIDGEEAVSNPMRLRVAPPLGYDERYLAQDVFTDDVGRAIYFDGTRVLDRANDTLREVADRLAKRRVAAHAELALGLPLTEDSKLLAPLPAGPDALAITLDKARPAEARKLLDRALLAQAPTMAESLGHVDFNRYVTLLADWLAEAGASDKAVAALEVLVKTLAGRRVRDRPVKPSVLKEIAIRKQTIEATVSPTKAKRRPRI